MEEGVDYSLLYPRFKDVRPDPASSSFRGLGLMTGDQSPPMWGDKESHGGHLKSYTFMNQWILAMSALPRYIPTRRLSGIH